MQLVIPSKSWTVIRWAALPHNSSMLLCHKRERIGSIHLAAESSSLTRPSSTACITITAVQDLVTDPKGITSSGFNGLRLQMLLTPADIATRPEELAKPKLKLMLYFKAISSKMGCTARFTSATGTLAEAQESKRMKDAMDSPMALSNSHNLTSGTFLTPVLHLWHLQHEHRDKLQTCCSISFHFSVRVSWIASFSWLQFPLPECRCCKLMSLVGTSVGWSSKAHRHHSALSCESSHAFRTWPDKWTLSNPCLKPTLLRICGVIVG